MADFSEITARVTIGDVLRRAGMEPGRKRMACPIHGGENNTAFSFTDSAFICHSCGAKGGLLALVELLHKCSKRDALERLHALAGLPFDRAGESAGVRFPYQPRLIRARRFNPEYEAASDKLKWLELLQYSIGVALRMLRRGIRDGRKPLDKFYSQEQVYLYELEELDRLIIEMNYRVNEIKRRGVISEFDITSSN